MIVVDTSALIAILRDEPEAEAFLRIMTEADGCLVNCVSIMEASMVLAGQKGNEVSWLGLDYLIARAGIEVVAHDAAMTAMARDAFLRFGKRRHPAALNMGDCATYALAKARGLPVLFKGSNFTLTDLMVAAPR